MILKITKTHILIAIAVALLISILIVAKRCRRASRHPYDNYVIDNFDVLTPIDPSLAGGVSDSQVAKGGSNTSGSQSLDTGAGRYDNTIVMDVDDVDAKRTYDKVVNKDDKYKVIPHKVFVLLDKYKTLQGIKKILTYLDNNSKNISSIIDVGMLITLKSNVNAIINNFIYTINNPITTQGATTGATTTTTGATTTTTGAQNASSVTADVQSNAFTDIPSYLSTHDVPNDVIARLKLVSTVIFGNDELTKISEEDLSNPDIYVLVYRIYSSLPKEVKTTYTESDYAGLKKLISDALADISNYENVTSTASTHTDSTQTSASSSNNYDSNGNISQISDEGISAMVKSWTGGNKYSSPLTSIMQSNYVGSTNVYSPLIDLNKNTGEKFVDADGNIPADNYYYL